MDDRRGENKPVFLLAIFQWYFIFIPLHFVGAFSPFAGFVQFIPLIYHGLKVLLRPRRAFHAGEGGSFHVANQLFAAYFTLASILEKYFKKDSEKVPKYPLFFSY